MAPDNFLTREQVDEILGFVTARDLFQAMPGDGSTLKGPEIAGKVFESAAERQGFGAGALDRVRFQDAPYLAQALGDMFRDEES